MLINNNISKKHVKFISYSGRYPNLCSGDLVLEIDGVECTFGYEWLNKKYEYLPEHKYLPFWFSGGSCGFHGNYESGYTNKGAWIIDVERIPDKYQKYAQEIDEVFNANVRWGCCGGCL